MTAEQLYKLKTELEIKASHIWQMPIEAANEESKEGHYLLFTLGVYAVLYNTETHFSNIVFADDWTNIIEYDFDSFNMALAFCLGLQQAKDNETKKEKSLLLLTNSSWNRKLYIDQSFTDHHYNNTYLDIAQICISRPLDTEEGKSSSLAYPLSKDDCRSIIEVLEGVIKN